MYVHMYIHIYTNHMYLWRTLIHLATRQYCKAICMDMEDVQDIFLS